MDTKHTFELGQKYGVVKGVRKYLDETGMTGAVGIVVALGAVLKKYKFNRFISGNRPLYHRNCRGCNGDSGDQWKHPAFHQVEHHPQQHRHICRELIQHRFDSSYRHRGRRHHDKEINGWESDNTTYSFVELLSGLLRCARQELWSSLSPGGTNPTQFI